MFSSFSLLLHVLRLLYRSAEERLLLQPFVSLGTSILNETSHFVGVSNLKPNSSYQETA